MKEYLKTAAPLFIITVVCAACLALTYLVTKEPIKNALAAKNTRTLELLLPQADFFSQDENFAGFDSQNYNAAITCINIGYADGSEPAGYVFEAYSTGYAGAVTVFTAIDASGRVYGVAMGENNETPGLGSNAAKPSFSDQFKNASHELSLTKKAPDPAKNEIAAVTGATKTSRAVINCVNAAIEYYNTFLK